MRIAGGGGDFDRPPGDLEHLREEQHGQLVAAVEEAGAELRVLYPALVERLAGILHRPGEALAAADFVAVDGHGVSVLDRLESSDRVNATP